MAAVDGHLLAGVASVTGRVRPLLVKATPTWFITTFYPPSGGSCRGRGGVSLRRSRPDPACKIVTWLILPVVICLSQRLSHACLSISNHTVKLRMAH